MATIYEVHLGILLASEIPEDFDEVRDDWETTLKGKRTKIHTNLSRVVPDEDAYLDVIVNRSNAGYGEFIGTDHPRFDEISLKRELKMERAKSIYITNRNNAFAEGGAFETGVTGNKEKFRMNAIVTWMVTGDRDKIYGLVPKAKYILQGKKSLFDAVVGNMDHVINETELKPFFKYARYIPSVVATINKWMTQVAYAILVGKDDTYIDTKIASKGNDELAGYVNANMLNPDLDPTTSAITIEKDATTGRWGVKIVEATP
ncbi:hypothetical protein DRN86_02125 [Candidatus Geothermarchaeota archaeon]|nr:MAG: hypothetical protein DRN86_02125 [Candidatus Geothermarchaeota archaeon]